MEIRFLLFTLAILSASPASAAGNICDGVEKKVCLSNVETALNKGRPSDAIAGLTFLCTSRGDSDGCVGAATLLSKQGHADTARSLLGRVCSLSINAGCDLLATLDIAAADYDGAASAYENACAQKEQTSCVQAERLRGQIARRKELTISCNSGEPEPCVELAALDKKAKQPFSATPSSGGDSSNIPDPTASAAILARVKAIQARHPSDTAGANLELLRLCEDGEGYACALSSSAELIAGSSLKAKDTSEAGCRDKSASACFVRFTIAQGEHNDNLAEYYFGLTCQYGGLKYCADVRKRLGAPERVPAQDGK